MVEHGGSSADSYLADPTSSIPSHCASIVATSTVRVNTLYNEYLDDYATLWFKHILFITRHDKGSGRAKSKRMLVGMIRFASSLSITLY